MSRIFAIGDIHGCVRTFYNLMDKIQIQKSDTIYLIGDYIDRGPDSKGVVDYILELRQKGYSIRTLRGNHDQMMMDSAKSKRIFNQWFDNGGEATLKSFGVKSYNELKPVYKQFFQRTRFYFENGPYIFVHAGINFGPDNIFEDRDALLWIRHFAIDKEKLGERKIIHGHTPVTIDEVIHPQHPSVYNIDAGCVHTKREGCGYLVAFNLTNRSWIMEKNAE